MFRLNPAELKRQFKKLGLKNVEIEAPETEEVIIKLADGKTLVALNPQVMIVRVPGGSAMIQVVAEQLETIDEGEASETQLSEEDVKFVAEQAGVSIEEARRALEEAGGDIAAALMLLAERKQAS